MTRHRSVVEHAKEDNHVTIGDPTILPEKPLDIVMAAMRVGERKDLELDGGKLMFVEVVTWVEVYWDRVKDMVPCADDGREVVLCDVVDECFVECADETRLVAVNKTGEIRKAEIEASS